ncbi:hypothetical protein D9757_002004 [Collybiopsis confluens]|uniref:BD-FAE-like domain-containing protein n=1 Tax=Collybiopsis confluens TaxID=2823264 RepID=A0A8H5MEE1_9AGAR|nr:hypothetical protein D9757_002004 [Collybiopsis confluens]
MTSPVPTLCSSPTLRITPRRTDSASLISTTLRPRGPGRCYASFTEEHGAAKTRLVRALRIRLHTSSDISDTQLDHSLLARSLLAATSFPVAVPNYRLSHDKNGVVHPAHAQDILECLEFIASNHAGLPPVFDPGRIFLIGHSCSAHIIASILLDSSTTFPSLTPSSVLLNAVQGVILSEGIYDIDLLLNDFPDYRSWFIADAFGDMPSYAPSNVATFPLRTRGNIPWLIIQSKGDTLINIAQSRAMLAHLKLQYDDGSECVQESLHDLDDEHDSVLLSPIYQRIVTDFIKDHSV